LDSPPVVSTNWVSRGLDWLEDRVLGKEEVIPRRKVVDVETAMNCSKCGVENKPFDFHSETIDGEVHYTKAKCPRCHAFGLQSDSMPYGMFD